MNIDNQLLLGIVFITAGVAMGLLAYAAFLNRQQGQEKEQERGEVDEGQLEEPSREDEVDQPTLIQSETEEDKVAAETVPQPIAEVEPVAGAEVETRQAEAPSERIVEAAAETIVGAQVSKPPAVERPTVTVDRDSNTGRLMIKVNERTYHSMETLRESDDWPLVTDLFSDLLAWMIKTGDEQQSEEDREPEEAISQPVSMVQQINTILGEKLAQRESGPQAVRLMEGVGGSIRVYIGVDSYSIEEVPDDEVKILIRQAVAEWEERQ